MNRYTIAGKIGEGAHGLVLKAFDNTSVVPRPVALKRILLKRIDDSIPISVIREVKTLQRLKHPYVRMLTLFFKFSIMTANKTAIYKIS